MAEQLIGLTARLAKLKGEEASRVSVYLVRGADVLGEARVQSDGGVRLLVSTDVLGAPSDYPLEVAIGPTGAGRQLDQIPGVHRQALNPEQIVKAKTEYALPLKEVKLTPEILAVWWEWCDWYCVSGTALDANGCPLPGAQVTVFSVAHSGGGGFTKTPQATVTTDANGHFNACFPWCSCIWCWPCWPCWPFWWWCWPWWWELDILHVIEAIERIPPIPPSPFNQAAGLLQVSRPATSDLMVGMGFAARRQSDIAMRPDAGRTASIRNKLESPALRAIFPWWWWCCDDPNIVFRITQGPNVVLDEDPATQTRWCYEEDSSPVTLVCNQQAVGVCSGDPKPAHGFVWTRVGNITVNNITGGYADGNPIADSSDAAFAGRLDIYGEFSVVAGVSYYQVNLGQLSGDPSRTAATVTSTNSLAAPLYNTAIILPANPLNPVRFESVLMGPFSSGGVTNLYSTQDQRTAVPGALLPPLVLNAGDTLFWGYNGLKVSCNSTDLVGATEGAVELSINGFDGAFAAVALAPNTADHLRLEIDNLPIFAVINSATAYDQNGNVVLPSGGGACPAYVIGPGGYVVLNVTVTDTDGHLQGYQLQPNYGVNQIGVTNPASRGYRQGGIFPPAPYQAPDVAQKSFVAGTENITFYPPEDCCYDMRLVVAKRVTNGYGGPGYYTAFFETMTIKL